MLFRLVRPMRRKESTVPYFIQRIPADVRERAAGLRLAIPVGDETIPIIISDRAVAVRMSLRTRDPSDVKVRQAGVAAYLESVWRALRARKPASLIHRQATALAGELYRAWANEDRGWTTVVEEIDGKFQVVRDEPDEQVYQWEAALNLLQRIGGDDDPNAERLERPLGALLDRLLLAKGYRQVVVGSFEISGS